MARSIRCYRDFSGGLSEAANDNMADNQLTQAMNIVPGDGFGIARACGTAIALPRLPVADYNRCPAEILELTLADGSTQTLVFSKYPQNFQDMYRLNGESWTQVVSGLAPMKGRFVHAHKLYWLTGVKLKVYDGSAVQNLAVTPAGGSATSEELAVWNKVEQAVAIEQRGQRWFYATAHNELIFSEIGDPARIDPTNIININTRDDDSITALQEFNGGLLIFKRRSVFYLAGWDFAQGSDITLTQLNVTSGTAFPASVQLVENAVLYLGQNGVYRLYVPQTGYQVAAEHLSERRISGALFSEDALQDAYAAVWDNTYYLSVRGAGSSALIREYRYFPALDAFFGPYTQEATCYSLLSDGRLYLGAYNGYLLAYDRDSYHYISSLDGAPTAIPIKAVTKGFDVAGAMVQDVKLKQALLAARQYKQESSHLSVRVKTDYTDNQYQLELLSMDESLIYDEGAYGEAYWGWKETVTKQMEINRKAKRVTFYLSDAHADEPLLVYGLAVVYGRRKVKGSAVGVSRGQVEYED